jgi:hypothetical protein
MTAGGIDAGDKLTGGVFGTSDVLYTVQYLELRNS